MKKLLELLFYGCWHCWEVLETKKILPTTKDRIRVDDKSTPIPIGAKYILQCKHCGEIKTFTTFS